MYEKKFLPQKKYYEKIKELTPRARIIYEDIVRLSAKKGFCYASDNFFMTDYKISRQSIWRILKLLIDKEYIEKDYGTDSQGRTVRKVYPKILYAETNKNLCTENSTLNNNKQCTLNGTFCGDIYYLSTENVSEPFKGHSTKKGTKENNASGDKTPDINTLPQKGKSSVDAYKKNMKNIQQTCNKNNTSDVKNQQQGCNNLETNDVTILEQTCNKKVAIDTNKDKIITYNDKRARPRAPLCVRILDQDGESITLPNPYKEKEDGYHD